MNRSEFIQTIMELYPGTFREDNEAQYQGWINRYKSALPENWDFDKLLKIFDREWKSTVIPPHPSFFVEFKNDVKPEVRHAEKIEVVSAEEKILIEQKINEIKQKMKSLAKQI